MDILPFNGLVLLLSILITLINIFLWLYFIKRLQDVRLKEKSINGDLGKIIEEARTQAAQLLVNATSQANLILTDTKGMKGKFEEELQRQIQSSIGTHMTVFGDVSEKINAAYDRLFQSMRQDFITHMEALTEKVKKLAEDNIKLYESLIKDQASTATLSIQNKIDQEFAKVQKDIDTYKQSEMQYIDRSMGKIILHVSKEILGREITVSDKKNLLIEALDKAKKEGIFNI